MEKKSELYQLMGVRMNGVMYAITNKDMDYQEIIRKSDKYSDRLVTLNLPKETQLLIDSYVSEHNSLGSWYGMIAYLLGFSDCRKIPLKNVYLKKQKKWFQKSNSRTKNYGKKGLLTTSSFSFSYS